MDMEVDGLSLEFDAPQYIDFLMDAEGENPDKWFDEREGDDGGIRASIASFIDQSSNFELATTALSAALDETKTQMFQTTKTPEAVQTAPSVEKTPKSSIPLSDRILRSTKKNNQTYSEVDSHEQRVKQEMIQKNASATKRSASASDATVTSEGSAKKKPKLDIKKSLLGIPRTPSMMRRKRMNSANGANAMSSEALKIKESERLKNKTSQQIKNNQCYMKKALCPGPLVARSQMNPTAPKEFKFATDQRIKQHDMQTRGDAAGSQKPFTSQLRKHSPSPTPLPKGPTKAKPFKCANTETQASKRRSQSDTEYKSMAALAMEFQTKTPERFRHTRKRTSSCSGLVSAAAAKPIVTCPKTPNLSTKQRARPVNVESYQDHLNKEIESMKSYKFKAKSFDHKIVEGNGMLGVEPLKRQKLTEVKPFDFEVDKRAVIKENKDKQDNNLSIAPTKSRRSAPGAKVQEGNQGSIYDRSKARRSIRDIKIKEYLKAEEKAREFHARPLPAFDTPHLPETQRKEPTKCQPFKMQGEHITAEKIQKFQEKVRKEEQENREKAKFKAQSSQVLYDAPFQPKPTKKPLTAIQSFNLKTDVRSKKREEFDQQIQKDLAEKEMQKMIMQKEQDIEENKAIKKLRRSVVHLAQPMPKYKDFEVKPSKVPLTEPHTPQFATKKRVRSLSSKMVVQ